MIKSVKHDEGQDDKDIKNDKKCHLSKSSNLIQVGSSKIDKNCHSDRNCQSIKSVKHDDGQDDKDIKNDKKCHLSKSSNLIQVGSSKIDKNCHSEVDNDDKKRSTYPDNIKLNTPTRGKIAKGKVADIRDMFDRKAGKGDDRKAVDIMRLRRNPMKPNTPSRGRRKKGGAVYNNDKTDLVHLKQTMISHYYRGKEDVERGSEPSEDDTG